MASRHTKLSNTAMPKSSDNALGHPTSRSVPSGSTRSPRKTMSRSSSFDGPPDLAFPGGDADKRSTAGSQPKRAGYAGSRTVNARSSTPTSIQDMGKSRFGSINSRDSSKIDTGQLDCGDGTGWGGKRP